MSAKKVGEFMADEYKRPLQGEWWVLKNTGSDQVYICGHDQDGDPLFQKCNGAKFDIMYLHGFVCEYRHEPRCTGWNWKPPEPIESPPETEPQVAGEESPNAHDWFGSFIGLQAAIIELDDDLTVAVIQENPRMVALAIAGLKAKADIIIQMMRHDMTNCRTAEVPESLTEELHPGDSSNDWVPQNRVPARPGIDQRAYENARGDITVGWEDCGMLQWGSRTPIHGAKITGDTLLLRCRRRDLPPIPEQPEMIKVTFRRWICWDDPDRYFLETYQDGHTPLEWKHSVDTGATEIYEVPQ